VKVSATAVGLVPAGAVTVTFTGPPVSGGEVAVIEVGCTFTPVAGVAPKSTVVTPEKFVPEIVTDVPPVVGPTLGLTSVTSGSGLVKANASELTGGLVPLAVVTVTSTFPLEADGDVAVIEEAECTVKDDAGCVPKSTAVAPRKFVPVTVTTVPPFDGPVSGLTLPTVGGGAMKVN
jgi:hypothetical protein